MQQYVLAFALLGCFVGLWAFLSKGRHLGRSDEKAVLGMEGMKDLVNETLANPQALASTMRLNTNRFACLSEGADFCKDKGGLFLLYGIEKKGGSFPVSQMADNRGFTPERASCVGFPSAACPIHVEATWTTMADNGNCDVKRSLFVQVRVVLNSGSIFLDWKTDKVLRPQVPFSAKALCRCEGKNFVAGECRLEPGREVAGEVRAGEVDDRRDEREEALERERQAIAQAETAVQDCPPVINFRNEEYPVSEVSPSGETFLQVEGEDNRCASVDVYRFQCAGKEEKGKIAAEWVFAGVEKGSCANPAAAGAGGEPTTNTANLAAPPSTPEAGAEAETASEAEAGRAPASAVEGRDDEGPQSAAAPGSENLLEVKQGIVNEETEQ